MVSPFSSARQMPVNVTTAPISVRPRVSFFTSVATSKASRCRRIVVVIVVTISAAGHRREKRDLHRTGNSRIGADMTLVDGGADHFGIFEGIGIALAALGQPSHQIGNGGNAGGRVHVFLRDTDALAHP